MKDVNLEQTFLVDLNNKLFEKVKTNIWYLLSIDVAFLSMSKLFVFII